MPLPLRSSRPNSPPHGWRYWPDWISKAGLRNLATLLAHMAIFSAYWRAALAHFFGTDFIHDPLRRLDAGQVPGVMLALSFIIAAAIWAGARLCGARNIVLKAVRRDFLSRSL